MYCPWCGGPLTPTADGRTLECVSGQMDLTVDMMRGLDACYRSGERTPSDEPRLAARGGRLFCAGCGVRTEEGPEGVLRCPQCRLCMSDFAYGLIEMHWHA